MVAATIAAVVYVVLNGPDQPATIRRQPSRAKDRRSQRAARTAAQASARAAAAQPPPSGAKAAPPTRALTDSDVMRLRVLPAGRTTLWVRIRSSVALVVLVGVLGALLALAIGGVLLAFALLIRSATG